MPNRSALFIIGEILDAILKAGQDGISKSQLINSVGLQTEVGEKYINQLLSSNYIQIDKQYWRDRIRNVILLTQLGQQRIEWLITLTRELQEPTKKGGFKYG